ncbi:MAG: heme biosynthesis protein HemY, partial [Rhodobacteraceae bacterium]|nr:heme biosynthesis protein HemY [Paracoccaceae bacterium]
AISAPRDPAWICDLCGEVHATWDPTCDNCGAFDTLSWKRPTAAEVQSSAAAKMLPMIVGEETAEVEAVEEDAAALPGPEVVDAEIVESSAAGAGKN